MNKYRDYDNYLKEHPTSNGYYGKYGGNYLEDPELITAGSFGLNFSSLMISDCSRVPKRLLASLRDMNH